MVAITLQLLSHNNIFKNAFIYELHISAAHPEPVKMHSPFEITCIHLTILG